MADDSCNADVTNLAFVDHGEGPAMLLVHGFPLDHAMWHHQIRELSDSFRVIAVDLPGFGASEPLRSSSSVSIGDYADALASLLDQLEIHEPVIYGGLSMGGYIGWQFLKAYGDRVTALVACDTRAAADDEKTARGRRLVARQIVKDGSASIAHSMAAKVCGVTTVQNQPDLIEQLAQTIADTDPKSIAAGQVAMAARPDMAGWVASIDVPVLLVVGQEDTITPPDEMRALAGQIPSSKLVEIPYAGHLAPLENPAAFNTALRAFLG